ncbi:MULTISPECIES: HAAS domain-containing protein [Sporolactobacillus]|uniref:HAAS transmembrane region domain-containing protein n=1 Tax=Sporolactobacillus nakayamae TaxID=269670 RepID=A0A1I2TPY9_9BACL|nr:MULTISPECIES: hypothetical protein [Sporolactobacillus]MCQ2010211.1 hypothetical protein [Sporolactobacillus sp. STSJ-5]SFG66219.1 hypothetical protein SAMN02982927_02382 [Sporolactobacillus nakayamae]
MAALLKERREFLQNLRIYLLSSGKKEEETEEIVGELEDHLYEAEKHGKSVQDIIGQSPKAYMEQLAGEMPFDYKNLLIYVPLILIGLICYNILNKAVEGVFSYSLLEAVGDIVITLIGLGLIIVLFKYVASSKLSKISEGLLFYGGSLTPIILLVALTYLDRAVDSPMIHLGLVWRILAVALACLFLIGIAIWAKTWVSIIIPFLSLSPELVLNQTGMQETSKTVLSTVITFLGLGIYIFIVFKRERKKETKIL